MIKDLFSILENKPFQELWIDLHKATTTSSAGLLGQLLKFKYQYINLTQTNSTIPPDDVPRWRFIKFMFGIQYTNQLANYYQNQGIQDFSI